MQLLRESTNTLITFTAQTLLGTGGEAQIHALPNEAHLVAKIYHHPNADYARKLALMLANPPFNLDDSQARAAIVWPVERLLKPDFSKQVAGFLMPRLHAMRPLMDFYNPRARRQVVPWFTYQYLHRTACNLAAAVNRLHQRGYVIGDVNESNVLVAENAIVTLVDTDSFQVRDPLTGTVIRCPVGKPEFTPPELIHARFAEIDRTVEHDRFGLAVLIFQILMEGAHPFAGVYAGAGEPPPLEARITAGHFSYNVSRTGNYRPMPTAPAFEMLTPALRQFFTQAFVIGHTLPSLRPTAQQWADALHVAEQTLLMCAANGQHRYGNHLRACPWCERTRLLNGRDPFPSPAAVQRGEHLRAAVRKSTVMSLPPSPYYQTPATAQRTYGTTSRVVYAASAPPVAPMTAYLNAMNTPAPMYWWTRWLQYGQRAMAGFLALAFLFLTFTATRVDRTSSGAANARAQRHPKSAAAYWNQLLDPELKVRALTLANADVPYAVVTQDKFLTLWDIDKVRKVQLFANYTDRITAAAVSPDGNMIVIGGHDAVLSFWDVATGAQRFNLKAHQKTISAVAFTPDGQTLASGGAGSDVRIWNVQRGEPLAHFDVHLAWVLALAFSPDGQILASAGAESRVQIYEQQDGQWRNTRMLVNSNAGIVALAFAPDRRALAAANLAGEILWWDLTKGELQRTIALPKEEIAYALAFSPNGQWLASGDSNGMVRVWSNAGQPLFERHGHQADVRALAFTANGQQLISAETGRKFWQQPSGAIREGGNVALKFWLMTEGASERVVNLAPYWLE
jgi:hypothetical protein